MTLTGPCDLCEQTGFTDNLLSPPCQGPGFQSSASGRRETGLQKGIKPILLRGEGEGPGALWRGRRSGAWGTSHRGGESGAGLNGPGLGAPAG